MIIIFSLDKKLHMRLLSLGILSLVAAACVLLKAHFNEIAAIFPRCLLEQATGYHCVSCGVTRATENILNGNIISAIYYNPLFVIVLTFFLLYLLYFLYSAFNAKKKPFKLAINEWHIYASAFVVLFFWFIRNTPFYQHYFY